MLRQSKAALKIQSLWRGYRVRKADSKAKKIMRERVKAVNAKFEQRILYTFFSLSLTVTRSSFIFIRYDNWQPYKICYGSFIGQETIVLCDQRL